TSAVDACARSADVTRSTCGVAKITTGIDNFPGQGAHRVFGHLVRACVQRNCDDGHCDECADLANHDSPFSKSYPSPYRPRGTVIAQQFSPRAFSFRIRTSSRALVRPEG